MIRERTPQVAEMVVHAMVGEQQTGCLGELQEASRRLDREGFWWRPSWPELLMADRRRTQPGSQESQGEWQHGWQYWAFRHVLQEDPDTVSPSSHLSRTSSVPLWTQCWSSARLRSHGTRVRDSPSPVPDHAFGKAPVASPDR